MKKIILITLITIGFNLNSAPMYVQSPVAQLLEKPMAGSPGAILPKGSVVTKIGEQDIIKLQENNNILAKKINELDTFVEKRNEIANKYIKLDDTEKKNIVINMILK